MCVCVSTDSLLLAKDDEDGKGWRKESEKRAPLIKKKKKTKNFLFSGPLLTRHARRADVKIANVQRARRRRRCDELLLSSSFLESRASAPLHVAVREREKKIKEDLTDYIGERSNNIPSFPPSYCMLLLLLLLHTKARSESWVTLSPFFFKTSKLVDVLFCWWCISTWRKSL